MKKIKITKMNGLGNDFVIVDYPEFEKANMPMSDFAIKVCNRNFGIGADGLIIPNLQTKDADIGWYFYNSDGTTAQMCGNGMRCFARYVTDNNFISKKEFSVKTLAGIIKPSVQEDGTVKVNMGNPILTPKDIPFNMTENLNQKLEICGQIFKINAISMGNPHCVIFIENDDDLLKLAENIGPHIECNKIFPEKTNVEFVRIKSKNEIDMRVWERGCGITLACGTGACASVVAGILNNLTDNKVKVNLLGGSLTVEWRGFQEDTKKDVYMTGPCTYSFFADYVL